FDVILTGGKEAILEKFAKYDARILFGADEVCWPDSSLADKYPRVKEPEMRYLDAGGFIGYAPEICEMVDGYLSTDTVYDQLYYTHIFLNRVLRHQWNIKLDTRADLFHSLNAAIDEVEIRYEGNHSYLYNLKTGTTPNVIHGNKAQQSEFLRLSNYLMGGWNPTSGCLSCKEDLFDLKALKEADYPTVLMGIFVEYPTPFIREFFQRVANLIYPKTKLQIYIHNAVEYHTKDVNDFVEEHGNLYSNVIVTTPEKNEADYPTVLMGIFVEYPTPFIREFFQRVANLIYPKTKLQIYIHNAVEYHTKDVNDFVEEHGNLYSNVIVTTPEKNVSGRVAKEWAMEECMRISCQYLLTLDSVVQITNPSLLTDLILQNRSIIAPMLSRPGKLWSNFWGALDQDGFYARSVDYMDIDPRLPGGYENVPTDDIHMNQVGLEQQWLKFLDSYIRPLQKKVYDGYDHGPPQASMNFIVRYKPDKQPLLRPHQDESTYTINIALNTPGVDFQGGGCRFIRYNCSITSPRKGWLFMHPGKLTHHHEGLRTTAGTRYIMISFVDP
ncbi:neurotrophic-like factor, partial [Plakobranchus ocellatus]